MGFGEWLGNKFVDGSEILGEWAYNGLEYVGWADDVLASETFNRLADIGDKQIAQLREGHVIRAAATGLTGTVVEAGRLTWDGVKYVASETNEGVKDALGVESWTGLAKDAFSAAGEWTSEKAGQVADYVGEKVDNILPDMPDLSSWEGWVAMLGGGFLGMAASNMIGGGMMTTLILGGAGVLAGLYIKDKYFSKDEEIQNEVSEAEKTETAEEETGQTVSVEGVSLDDTKVLSNGPAVSAFSGENVDQEEQEQTEEIGTQEIESGNEISYLYPQVQSSLNKLAA